NPARNGTEVILVLPVDESQLRDVRVRLISLTGTILYDEVPAQQELKWNGLRAGMYMIQLLAPGKQYRVQKLLVN
ncbi:MAG: T9SS type A sorting domain-containing protein, partial [Bacteroidales bacterium]|nr:T9SS type A sorting domain-containing protein [Bacteroidales bacterium]